jgi:hypothetical protein
MYYFPLVPRILEMCRSPIYRRHITPRRTSTDDEASFEDVTDGIESRRLFHSTQDGDAATSCQLSFLLAVAYDGTIVTRKVKKASEMWPLLVTILNLPPAVRSKLGVGTFIVALVPGLSGTRAESELLRHFFVPELKMLNEGIVVHQYDTTVRARVAVHVYDTKGWQKVLHVHGPGSRVGCLLCRQVHGQYRGSKIVHLGHRYICFVVYIVLPSLIFFL